MRAPPSPPDIAADAFRQAQLAHLSGRLAEAEGAYLDLLSASPDDPEILGLLGLAQAERGDGAAAELTLRRHLQLEPGAQSSRLALGRLCAERGDDEEALAFFDSAIRTGPALAPIHNDLGAALHRLGRDREALEALDRALSLDPDFQVALANRALVLAALGRVRRLEAALRPMFAQATPESLAGLWAGCLKALARARKPAGAEAMARRLLAGRAPTAALWEPLAALLDELGRPGEASAIRDEIARAVGLQRGGRAEASATRVLVLGAVGAGHVPTRYLLDPEVFDIWSLMLLSPEAKDGPLGSVAVDSLRRADVVFSTLANAERDAGQLAAADQLCRALGRPVLNPPSSIARTARTAAATLFADLPDVVAPQTWRVSRARLAGLALEAPWLVRPLGTHGGEGLALLRCAAERDAYLAQSLAEELLLTRFHDFRSADGQWRKYRLIFVDRKAYPYHLAIGDGWLLHYWRTQMSRSAAKREEEAGFLADWRRALGPRAATAVDAVGRRLDLDYGGLDCAVAPDGRLLLFEANGCFLLHLDEPAHLFPAKPAAVSAIRQAFSALVEARARP